MAVYRPEVVFSASLGEGVRNNLINAGILVISLDPDTLASLQDTVEADPGIVLTVDVGSGDVRVGRELIARAETMAGRLLMAQRMLDSASLPGDVRMRLQRGLVAICDAMKAPGADVARSARRLDRFLAELAATGPAAPAPAPAPGPGRDAGAQTGAGAPQAPDPGAAGGSS